MMEEKEMASSSKEGAKILVVDDSEQNVQLLQVHLEGAGYRVIPSYTSEEALEKVQTEGPDIVLLDIMMPRISGYEVCRRIKSDEKTKLIPVVMITALGELEDIEKGVEVGADDFLTKPISKVELLARVRSMLRVRRLESELQRTLAYVEDLHRKGHAV